MNKSMKPAVATAQRPLTEEEKRIRVMQLIQQKRETFSINILCHLVTDDCKVADVVNKSVELADALIEKLYPLPETGAKDNE